eukprot:scaffold7059_cov250-Pinguiococcus_pyrenoidosus.AAC.3
MKYVLSLCVTASTLLAEGRSPPISLASHTRFCSVPKCPKPNSPIQKPDRNTQSGTAAVLPSREAECLSPTRYPHFLSVHTSNTEAIVLIIFDRRVRVLVNVCVSGGGGREEE